jgi:hypothetical protein
LQHVFEEVGEKRQRAGILDRFLVGTPADVAGKMIVLETGGQKLGRPVNDLKQLRRSIIIVRNGSSSPVPKRGCPRPT